MTETIVNFYNGDTLVGTVTVSGDTDDAMQVAATARAALIDAEASVDGERFTAAEIDEWWA